MDRLIKLLRQAAKVDAEEGEYSPSEHVCWVAADTIERLSVPVSLLDDFQQEAFEWSVETFGVRGVAGPINHLKSECDEILEKPLDIEEYADAWLLIQDAAARAGFKMSDVFQAAQLKCEKNKKRNWPARGEVNEHGFTEHKK